MSEAALLEAHGVCTYYGKSQALFDVSLHVPARGAVAILGRNGAGKTTLLKTLVGDLLPRSGSVRFDGVDATKLATEARVRRGLGHVPQEQGIFGRLSVKENLLVGMLANANGESRLDEVLTLFPRLRERLTQQAGTLSGGERKMLAISRALLGSPKLLLLDEPTEGVWIGVVEEIAQRLAALAQQISILIVEQHVELALRIAEYCYVMDRGKIALAGRTEQLRNDPNLSRLLAP
jgi:branched-chain amino acid transport system ATP-binding protein